MITKFNITERLDEYEFDIEFDEVIKPYQRNRSGRGHTYDPLNTYKNKLKKEILINLKDNNFNIPLSGYCYFNIDIYTTLPKTKQTKKRIANIMQKINKLIRPITKPDLDNVAKTTFDLFNNLIYIDDNQIVETTIKKYYSLQEKTILNIIIEKELYDIKGR